MYVHTGYQMNLRDPHLRRYLPPIILAIFTFACCWITIWSLQTGFSTAFENLFFLPIILACFWYTWRGLLYSCFLVICYLLLMMESTPEPILIPIVIQGILFTSIAGIITLLTQSGKKSEDTFRHINNFQKQIIKNARVWLMVLDQNGTILVWNTAAEEISGYLAEEVMGKREIWKLLYPETDERSQITETITQIISKETYLENFETRIRTRGGEERIISWNTREISEKPSGRSAYISIGVDVTDMHQAQFQFREREEELRTELEEIRASRNKLVESEDRWSDLVAKSQNAIAVYRAVEEGTDFVVVDFNPAAAAIEKVNRDEIIGKKVTEVFPGIEASGILPIFKQVWKTGIPQHHQISFYQDDQREGWRENRVYQLSSGEIAAIYADVTEHRRNEEVIKETNAYLENLISIANVPILIWDQSFRITRINHAGEELIGRSADEVIGNTVETLIPPDQSERTMRLLRTTLEGVRWETVGIDILHKDGSVRNVLWNSATLYTSDGITPVATIVQGRDISGELQLENERDAALVQIQKNLAQLAVLNDEIRNPLTIIMAYVDLFHEPEAADRIIEQIGRIDEIVTHLDKRWVESEKVLTAIRKHYHLFVSPPSSRQIAGEDEYQELSGEITGISDGKEMILVEEIQAELYTILDSIDALIYVADMDTYDLLYLNRRGRSLFGDIGGKKCYHTIQKEMNGPCQFCTNHLLLDQSGPTGVFTWEVQNSHNGRWYDCRDRAIRWTDGRIVRLEIATDITERKKGEEELIKTINELRQFNALTVGREVRMIELKSEINALLQAAGMQEKYRIDP